MSKKQETKEDWIKFYGEKDPWGNDWKLESEDKLIFDKQQEYRDQKKEESSRALKLAVIRLVALFLVVSFITVVLSLFPNRNRTRNYYSNL